MIMLVIQYLQCMLPIVKIFSGKFYQHLLLYCGSVKQKFKSGPGYWFLRVLWFTISKKYWQVWHSFFKYTLKSSFNFYPIKITWRKMAHSVCLKPEKTTGHLYTLWHFTVPAYLLSRWNVSRLTVSICENILLTLFSGVSSSCGRSNMLPWRRTKMKDITNLLSYFLFLKSHS